MQQKIMRLSQYGLEIGAKADLVVLNAKNIDEAIGLQPNRSFVIKNGNVIYRSNVEHTINY